MITSLMKFALGAIVFLSITGCNESSSKAKIIEKKEVRQVKEQHVQELPKEDKVINISSEASDIFYGTFKDTAKIAPHGKNMILIFGTNTDPYTMKLKEDIYKSKDIQKRLKNNYSSYYFKAHNNLRHKLYHEKELMDVDTKTMISIYNVTATPTFIFSDKENKAILVVPGYMPAKQFLVTMDFIDSNKWQGKDRKNGDVYKALKEFYIKKGIITK